MADFYEWLKALHIISVISWMAGLFYMPRLFMYHTKAEIGSEMDKTFQTMEYRLLKIIMNPAMISTYIFGLTTAYIYGLAALGIWFHIKMLAVIILTIIHGLLARWRKNFAGGKNLHSENFYKIFNEVPVFMMIVAVIMVVIKPFE
jgi:putative membrane protein